ncbi:putative enoyl-CoA hydratase [Burkholderiales bacterium]|nr:putative enoyl-CoA hydratase [Burkholderiales bacterium]
MNAFADVRYLPHARFEHVDTRFDRELGIYWAWMNPKPRPFFSPQLLVELSSYVDTIENGAGTMVDAYGETGEVRYAVIASKTPGVFNLGGDLSLFKTAITRRERATLVHYGRSCVDTLYRWWKNCDLPLTTISLVQGDALGGGFECALSSSVLIAEEDARMGFPEILFNLFPGMGAYSFLSRKVGRRTTEELLTSGTIYTARQLYDLGVVDVITPTGTGAVAVESYARKHARAANGRRGVEAIAKELNPLKHEELVRVVELWADAALKLSERDLRMMERLVRAQQRQSADEPLPVGASNVVPLAVGAGD